VGFSEAAEEILALAPYRNHFGIWRPDDIRKRIRDRDVYLHAVLITRSEIGPGDKEEGIRSEKKSNPRDIGILPR
jgi:hypothetical protein